MPYPFAHPLLRPKPVRRVSLLNAFNYHLEVEGQNPRSCARNLSMVAHTISETTLLSAVQQMHLIKNPDISRHFIVYRRAIPKVVLESEGVLIRGEGVESLNT